LMHRWMRLRRRKRAGALKTIRKIQAWREIQPRQERGNRRRIQSRQERGISGGLGTLELIIGAVALLIVVIFLLQLID
jgi:hypothetical protein